MSAGKAASGEERDLEGQPGTRGIPQLKRENAGHVPARGIPAERDFRGIDTLVSGMIEKPANHVLDLVKLSGVLGFRRQLVLHRIGADPGLLGDQPHGHLKLVQGPVGEASAVNVDQRAARLRRRLGGDVAADGERPVRSGQDQGVDAPDSRPGTDPELPVVAPTLGYIDVRAQDGSGRQSGFELGIQLSSTDRLVQEGCSG